MIYKPFGELPCKKSSPWKEGWKSKTEFEETVAVLQKKEKSAEKSQ